MRFLVIVVITCAWFAGWLAGGREPGGTPRRSPAAPAHDAARPAAAHADGAPSGRSRLVALWEDLRGVESPPEPPPDRLVHCEVGGTRTFMRESKCLAIGRVPEQRWTILD